MSRVIAVLGGDIEVSEVSSKPAYLTEWSLLMLPPLFVIIQPKKVMKVAAITTQAQVH